jgi:adenylylsulfate kinase
MKILICGLSGAGKTYLAERLQLIFEYEGTPFSRLNGDTVRIKFNDWDFSKEGRIRQATRMNILSYELKDVIIDFIAPLQEMRDLIKPDFTIWMNTISESRYKDTDLMFEKPKQVDIVITSFDYNILDVVELIEKRLYII